MAKITLKIILIFCLFQIAQAKEIKGLSKIIKRDKPALIVETGNDINVIGKYLKKYGFEKYQFLNVYNKFMKIKFFQKL